MEAAINKDLLQACRAFVLQAEKLRGFPAAYDPYVGALVLARAAISKHDEQAPHATAFEGWPDALERGDREAFDAALEAMLPLKGPFYHVDRWPDPVAQEGMRT